MGRVSSRMLLNAQTQGPDDRGSPKAAAVNDGCVRLQDGCANWHFDPSGDKYGKTERGVHIEISSAP